MTSMKTWSKPSCNFCIDFWGRMERSGSFWCTNHCNKTWPAMTFGECCAIRRHGTVTDSFEEICFANCPWKILGVTGDGDGFSELDCTLRTDVACCKFFVDTRLQTWQNILYIRLTSNLDLLHHNYLHNFICALRLAHLPMAYNVIVQWLF